MKCRRTRRSIPLTTHGGRRETRAPVRAAHLAMRLSESAQRKQRDTHGTESPYPHDLVVWPEAARDVR